ncbi:MAG: hypothetical protein ACJA1A_003675 [Saprospiraceae bacterium]|jgi:hypothetical protein
MKLVLSGLAAGKIIESFNGNAHNADEVIVTEK